MTPQEFLDGSKARAKKLQKRIVYPDALDERAIQAARIVTDESIAKITLIGPENQIIEKADSLHVSLSGIEIVDPERSAQLNEYAQTFFELRKHKGIQFVDAQSQMKQPLFFGAMMVRKGFADGSLAGSISTTGDVIRAGILCIGLQKGIDTVSSFFLMIFPDKIFAFADCAVLPDPTPAQLADIAITTAINYQKLLQEEPRVAMLSFSTKGSADHPLVEKVQNATTLAQQKRIDIIIDGEMQFDAAVIPSIGKKKAPESKVAGSANVLVFPDLNAGNIGYKIAQRLGNAEAIGPIVQGLNKPAFDLSRGCSVNDIVSVTAFNAVMG